MRNFRVEGIIIKRKNYGEADRMLTVFSKRLGKIQVKATGIRRIPSRRASHLELLNHSVLTLYKGFGIPIVTEAQTIEDFSQIKENLTKVGFAYHLCELINGLCAENQEHQSVFDLFKNTLFRLSLKEEIKSIIHEFEIELLSQLGFYRSSTISPVFNTALFIEQILERKLKSKQIFSRLAFANETD